MSRQQSQNDFSGDLDEHDQPTEPMMPVFSPSSTTIADGVPTHAGDVIPMPQPHDHPFPSTFLPDSPYNRSAAPVYPVLPPAPAINKNGRSPAGSATPAHPGAPDKATQATGTRPGRSRFPVFVGLFFVAVQLLLLVYFVLQLVALPGKTPWVGLIYTFSSLFLLPFRLLMQNIAVPIPLEIYTLLAILIYGLLSRILVRFLKILLRSR